MKNTKFHASTAMFHAFGTKRLVFKNPDQPPYADHFPEETHYDEQEALKKELEGTSSSEAKYEETVNKFDDNVLRFAARGSEDKDFMNFLVGHQEGKFADELLNNPNLPEEIIENIHSFIKANKANKEKSRMLPALLVHKNTPASILMEHVNDEDRTVRFKIALNPNSTPEILKMLAYDKDVAIHVWEHPNATPEIKEMAEDTMKLNHELYERKMAEVSADASKEEAKLVKLVKNPEEFMKGFFKLKPRVADKVVEYTNSEEMVQLLFKNRAAMMGAAYLGAIYSLSDRTDILNTIQCDELKEEARQEEEDMDM